MIIGDSSSLLRRSLKGNAWFSGLSGLVFLMASRPIASFLGLEVFWIIPSLGLGLTFYAFWLALAARRPTLDRREVWIAIGLDAAWVLGSGLLLIANLIPLTLPGRWAVGIVAGLVATFALLQFHGLTRPQQASQAP